MSVIDVVRLHQRQELTGALARIIAQAAYVFETGEWRRRWREAVEREDYSEMDRLDRAFERIGLP